MITSLRQGSPKAWIYEIVNGPACDLPISDEGRGDNQALWLRSNFLLGGERGGGGSLRFQDQYERRPPRMTAEGIRPMCERGCCDAPAQLLQSYRVPVS